MNEEAAKDSFSLEDRRLMHCIAKEDLDHPAGRVRRYAKYVIDLIDYCDEVDSRASERIETLEYAVNEAADFLSDPLQVGDPIPHALTILNDVAKVEYLAHDFHPVTQECRRCGWTRDWLRSWNSFKCSSSHGTITTDEKEES